jgi:hypothetical protein
MRRAVKASVERAVTAAQRQQEEDPDWMKVVQVAAPPKERVAFTSIPQPSFRILTPAEATEQKQRMAAHVANSRLRERVQEMVDKRIIAHLNAGANS